VLQVEVASVWDKGLGGQVLQRDRLRGITLYTPHVQSANTGLS